MTKNKQTCLSCSAVVEPGDQFCSECGAALPYDEGSKENKRVTIIFYIFMAILFLLWLLQGMPMDRFWWRNL